MTWWEALLLGWLQGLTEFLPVSSSGHLELGRALLGLDLESGLLFNVVVHAATALSTLVVFRKPIMELLRGLPSRTWNREKSYTLKLALSMLPVLVVGLLFKDAVEGLFSGRIVLVGAMLCVTATLLLIARHATGTGEPGYGAALLIGVAQAVAVLPGISRSGATIACALLLGVRREEAARFAFLMALPPILGAALLELLEAEVGGDLALPLVLGFCAAFVGGVLACRWMVRLVVRQRLGWFAGYCAIVGGAAMLWGSLRA